MHRLLSFLPIRASLPLISVLLTSASGGAQQSVLPSAPGYSVRGTVINSATGQPVVRALVDLNDRYAMLTGGDGAFSFDNLPAGTYMATVRKPGYIGFGSSSSGFQARGAFPAPPQPARRIQVGDAMPALTFRITPEGVVAGTITLSTADPADGIQVMIFHQQMEGGHEHWTLGGMTATNSEGEFRFAGLPAGSYMIATQPSLDQPAGSISGSGPVWGFPGLYYPGVTDPSSAGVLHVAPGQQAEADLTLTRQAFFPVTVLVRMSEAQLPANFQILDSGGRPAFLPVRFDNRTQLIHARVPSGAWLLDGHAYARTQYWGRSDFQVAGAPAAFAVSMVPSSQIPVIVHRDFETQAGYSGPGLNLFLIPAGVFGTGGMGGGMAQSHAGGASWEIDVNEPGKYWVVAEAYAPGYVSSITSGGTNLANTPIVVTPGSSPAPIEVTLRNDSGSISGQISLGNPPGATNGEQRQVWVYAIPLFASAGQVQSVVAADTGQFTISNLAPGSYRVVACDSPQQIDFHSPEIMARWATTGSTVTVDPRGSASAQLDVIHMEAAY